MTQLVGPQVILGFGAGTFDPFWYCGGTPRSARLAVEFCDGWMPGRIGMLTLAKRMETIRRMSEEAGRGMPTTAVIPPSSIESTREKVLGQVNIRLLAWANRSRFEQIELVGTEVLPEYGPSGRVELEAQ